MQDTIQDTTTLKRQLDDAQLEISILQEEQQKLRNQLTRINFRIVQKQMQIDNLQWAIDWRETHSKDYISQ